jgi:hypothetical protein
MNWQNTKPRVVRTMGQYISPQGLRLESYSAQILQQVLV